MNGGILANVKGIPVDDAILSILSNVEMIVAGFEVNFTLHHLGPGWQLNVVRGCTHPRGK